MADVSTPAESSPAFAVPSNPEHYAAWRHTGKLPESPAATPKKEESAPSKEKSANGDEPEEKGAPAPEAGKEKQESQAKPRSNAETRLKEILDDLKKAGLSPAELKTFKRELQQQNQPEPKNQPEKTENPASKLEAPKKPKVDDFDDYAKYEEAKDKYFEDLADYKAAKKLEEFQQGQQTKETERQLNEKVAAAKKRYGEEAVGIIGSSAGAIFGDEAIPAAVKAVLDGSDVLVDLLYALGSKNDEFQEFVALAKSNPAAAIRKAVLVEHLVSQELAKPAKDGGEGTPARGEDGKFAKQTPEKKVTEAPPPPKEVSGRSAAPPDEIESAAKSGDFRAFKEAANRRDIARRRGQ